MQKTMRVEPISAMQQRPQQVLEQLSEGPVMLSVRGKGAAVVTSIEDWDRIADRLNFLERSALADQRSRSVAAGEWVSSQEVDQTFAEMGIS